MAELTQSGTKMIKTRVGGANGELKFIRPSELTEGEVYMGRYISAAPSRFNESRNDYKLEEINEDGENTGRTLIYNGSGNLDNRMADLSVGTVVAITYEGKQKIKKGKFAGKEAHNFSVDTVEFSK